MSAYLLTWNPKYYDIDRENQMVDEYGKCNSYWSTNCRQMEPGDHLLLMRQGSEPRGIVAGGYTRKHNQFLKHAGRWYVSVMWKWVRPELPVFSLDDLRMLFPDQHWSPRGSGIEIKPPVDEELTELIQKALNEENNDE